MKLGGNKRSIPLEDAIGWTPHAAIGDMFEFLQDVADPTSERRQILENAQCRCSHFDVRLVEPNTNETSSGGKDRSRSNNHMMGSHRLGKGVNSAKVPVLFCWRCGLIYNATPANQLGRLHQCFPDRIAPADELSQLE
jgi:hypothetical protein